MAALYRAATARQTADGLAPAGAGAGQTLEAGLYLTDEVFSYRVVAVVASAAGDVVELEDCYQLDAVRVPVRDVQARRLRVVSSAHLQ